METLHFLNLQYWYCLFYSFFGDGCAFMRDLETDAPTPEETKGIFEFLVDAFSGFGSGLFGVVGGVIATLWGWFSALSYGLSFFLGALILFALFGLLMVRLRERGVYGTLPPEDATASEARTVWENLLEDAKSTDPKRWRAAILAADDMLGELLLSLGYEGMNTGERIRHLPEDAFVTVPVAWEAHRIKNLISSGASDFILTQREAFRTMKLYEQVFEEFDYV